MYNKENLSKIQEMNSLAPEVMKAFWEFDKLAVADGAIPVMSRTVTSPGRIPGSMCTVASSWRRGP